MPEASERAYKTYKFKSTGVTVVVPPVSVVNLQNKFSRNNPPPEPPLTEVDMGNGPEWVRNEADPNWIESVRLHQERIGLMVMEAVIFRVALKQDMNDERRAEVKEIREALSHEELHKNDKIVWFQEVASGTDVEVAELAELASGLGDPQAKGVQQEQNSFRSAVQGNGHLEVSGEEGSPSDIQSRAGVD
jgi:hypothetical protein